MKNRTLTLTMLCILLAAATAFAQPGPGRGAACDGPAAGPVPHLERMAERLGLSEAQTEAIRAIQDKSREQGSETRKQILRLRNELEGLMLQDAPDAGAAAKLIRRIGELRTEQQVRRMETRLAVRAQLTEEQRERMPMMGHQGRSGHGGRGGRGDCGDRGGCGGCDQRGGGERGDGGERGGRHGGF